MDTALNGLLDPLSRCLDAESARRVIELRIDPAVQSRIDALAKRANNGQLSEEEQVEYEAFINGGGLHLHLKAQGPETPGFEPKLVMDATTQE